MKKERPLLGGRHSQGSPGLAILFITYHFLFKKLLPPLSPPHRSSPIAAIAGILLLGLFPLADPLGCNESVTLRFPGEGEKQLGAGLTWGAPHPRTPEEQAQESASTLLG